MTGAQFRVLRVNELTVHGWDLARAIGANEDLDDGLVEWLFDRLYPLRDTIARSGLVAPRQPSREEAKPSKPASSAFWVDAALTSQTPPLLPASGEAFRALRVP